MKKKATIKAKVRIVLVDDHPIVREYLAQLINQQADLVVSGGCSTAAECLELLEKTKVDLAIVDLSLKGSHGLDLIKDLKIRHPKLPVLVLSMHDEFLYAERALRAGARGYVTKQEAPAMIMDAIRAAIAGEVYVSEKIARHLVGTFVHGRKPVENGVGSDRLTDREVQVLQLIGQGHPTREVADLLHIDVKTVETYRARLKHKLNITNAEELRQQARQWSDDETV